MKGHTYIAIDLKSFYASVECVERGLDPLTTNLVVADEERTEKTICLAVTPSLKAYGLSGRSRLFEVQAKAREIEQRTGKPLEFIIAKPRMAKYMEYSANIYSVYLKYFSKEDIVVYSVDEVFIDVTPYLKTYKMTAHNLTRMVIQDVLKTTGVTATAGIAPNLYLCKIAMDIVAKHSPADKDGVRIAELDVMKYRKLLWKHKPLTDFWQTGAGTVRRLNQCGIYTMEDICRFSLVCEDVLYKVFGINAEILIDHAWGYEPVTIKDINSYKPKAKSISNGQVLHKPYTTNEARVIVREMIEQTVLSLVEKGLVCKNVTLYIGYDVCNKVAECESTKDFYGRKIPAPTGGTANMGTHTASAKIICEKVMELFDKVAVKDLYVRRINISANDLIEDVYSQYDLFTDPVEIEREKSIQKTIVNLQHRFGKNALLKGHNFLDCATTKDRNSQIGGHRA